MKDQIMGGSFVMFGFRGLPSRSAADPSAEWPDAPAKKASSSFAVFIEVPNDSCFFSLGRCASEWCAVACSIAWAAEWAAWSTAWTAAWVAWSKAP